LLNLTCGRRYFNLVRLIHSNLLRSSFPRKRKSRKAAGFRVKHGMTTDNPLLAGAIFHAAGGEE
jgi:hypothetical protein